MTKEDCISRQAAIEVFGDIHPMDYNTQAFCDAIKALPSVERRGKWIDNGRWYVCSECGTEMPFTGVYDKSQRYCFNCGAKMEE